MTTYSAEELAAAAGTDVAWVRRMTELHVLEDEGGRYRDQDIARVRIAEGCRGRSPCAAPAAR